MPIIRFKSRAETCILGLSFIGWGEVVSRATQDYTLVWVILPYWTRTIRHSSSLPLDQLDDCDRSLIQISACYGRVEAFIILAEYLNMHLQYGLSKEWMELLVGVEAFRFVDIYTSRVCRGTPREARLDRIWDSPSKLMIHISSNSSSIGEILDDRGREILVNKSLRCGSLSCVLALV